MAKKSKWPKPVRAFTVCAGSSSLLWACHTYDDRDEAVSHKVWSTDVILPVEIRAVKPKKRRAKK